MRRHRVRLSSARTAPLEAAHRRQDLGRPRPPTRHSLKAGSRSANASRDSKCRCARVVGLIVENSTCTGRPSSAPKSMGVSRKQSVTSGAGTRSKIGLRGCGIATPSPTAVEPSASRASKTLCRKSGSTSAGSGMLSTRWRRTESLSLPGSPWTIPPASSAAPSVGMDSAPAAAGSATGRPRAIAHSTSSSRLRKRRPATPWEGKSPFSTCSINARSDRFSSRAASLTVNCMLRPVSLVGGKRRTLLLRSRPLSRSRGPAQSPR